MRIRLLWLLFSSDPYLVDIHSLAEEAETCGAGSPPTGRSWFSHHNKRNCGILNNLQQQLEHIFLGSSCAIHPCQAQCISNYTAGLDPKPHCPQQHAEPQQRMSRSEGSPSQTVLGRTGLVVSIHGSSWAWSHPAMAPAAVRQPAPFFKPCSWQSNLLWCSSGFLRGALPSISRLRSMRRLQSVFKCLASAVKGHWEWSRHCKERNFPLCEFSHKWWLLTKIHLLLSPSVSSEDPPLPWKCEGNDPQFVLRQRRGCSAPIAGDAWRWKWEAGFLLPDWLRRVAH